MHLDLITTIIAAVPAVLAAIVSIINSRKLNVMHVKINSRLDELIASARAEGHAKGVAQEKADQSGREKGLTDA